MIHTLAERDGSLYATETFVDEWEPRRITNWYLLNTTLAEFVTWFASETLMHRKIGCTLFPQVRPASVWKDEQGWTYRITSGFPSERTPAFTDIVPIPAPLQRGRKYQLQWHKGAWYKETKRGLVVLDSNTPGGTHAINRALDTTH